MNVYERLYWFLFPYLVWKLLPQVRGHTHGTGVVGQPTWQDLYSIVLLRLGPNTLKHPPLLVSSPCLLEGHVDEREKETRKGLKRKDTREGGWDRWDRHRSNVPYTSPTHSWSYWLSWSLRWVVCRPSALRGRPSDRLHPILKTYTPRVDEENINNTPRSRKPTEVNVIQHTWN